MMDKLKKVARFFTPRITTYIVLSNTADRVVESARQYSLPAEYELDCITSALRPSIERDRPGYWRMANHYLDAGYEGFCIRLESTIAAMGWFYHNSDRKLRYATYYPLEPGRIWFHADWVNPMFRGRELHKSLLYHRAAHVEATLGDVMIELNVEPNNVISLHNCEKVGFRRECMLHVLRLGGLRFCWQNRLNL